MVNAKPPRTLHPKLAAHGLKVKAAHAHLAATSPRFKSRMKMVQQHIRTNK